MVVLAVGYLCQANMGALLASIWTAIKPITPGDWWTLILAVGTWALTWVAYRGLRSLSLAKRDMLTRATRECPRVRNCEV